MLKKISIYKIKFLKQVIELQSDKNYILIVIYIKVKCLKKCLKVSGVKVPLKVPNY